MSVRILFFVVGGLLLCPSLASAQNESNADLEEARALYLAGNAAVQSGRWADAVKNFERAYELSKVPAALYNLGISLRALGRHKEAKDSFSLLLSKHGSSLSAAMKQSAERSLQEEKQRIAVLVLNKLSSDVKYQITIDGKLIPDTGARPLILEIDSGQHAVYVERENHKLFRWQGNLDDGQQQSVDVDTPPLATEKATLDVIPPAQNHFLQPDQALNADTESSSVLESPLFWTIIGVVVIGAAIGGYFLLSPADERLSPMSDTRVKL
ncbi:MAG: tetratricopeptide repeat protein [Myxococcales bacterium]|nr:MAG: tetratricopeptide repeat protein [Myxococcales bacterium]